MSEAVAVGEGQWPSMDSRFFTFHIPVELRKRVEYVKNKRFKKRGEKVYVVELDASSLCIPLKIPGGRIE